MNAPFPWKALPVKPPFVLPQDRPYIMAFNAGRNRNDANYVRTDLIPEPFFGRRDAPVVVLLLNPGASPQTDAFHGDAAFRRRLIADMRGTKVRQHFHLTDSAHGPGRRWWERTCASLIRHVGQDVVARNLLAVEFFAYPSRSFSHGHLRLPSQAFTFELVRRAIDRGAEIICLRGERLWHGAVPELRTYRGYCASCNPRCSAVSEANTPRFAKVLRRLR